MSKGKVAPAICPECKMLNGKPHAVSCSKSVFADAREQLNGAQPETALVLDGKTGGVIETTVDGKTAKIKFTDPETGEEGEMDDPAETEKGIKRVAPPLVHDLAHYIELQRAVDDKAIFALPQPLTKTTTCEAEWFDEQSEQSVGCSAAAAFDFEEQKTCPTCQHTAKTKVNKYCLAHMALRIAGLFQERQLSLLAE